MNEYVETVVKIKDTVSEFIPAKLSVIIKLAELAFETFGKVDDSLNSLYKKAFKEAVENVAKDESIGNIRNLLNEFKSIDSFTSLQELTEHLTKTSKEMGLYLSKNDFSRITGNISEEFNTIILNDKYDKLYKCFILRRETDTLDKDIKDVKKFLHEIYNSDFKIKADNKLYNRDFTNPLFMHRRNVKITLRDLFVTPNVSIRKKKNIKNCDAVTAIGKFVQEDTYDVLFIEGWGGYGKSSIVSFLAYNYEFNKPSGSISFLKDRQLIIIRLRDLQGDNKIKAIEEKLNNKIGLEQNAILIFDGLDELCMIERLSCSNIAQDIVKTFSYYPQKVIITTRQTYVDYTSIDSLGIMYDVVEIQCFDETKRIKFAGLFSQKDKNHIEAVKYIQNLPLEKQKNSSIYGSPFLLYLILSGGIKENEKNNSWLLMHRLFHDELFNPLYSYNRGIDNETVEKIYQFNCEIAFEMFKTQNQKLFITTDELKKLLPDDDIKDMIKKSHGLFSYMRKSDSGTIEFVHNHVRDYFLCEKILREISKLYLNDNYDGYQIAIKLSELLMYDNFTDEVKLFIGEAFKSKEYKPLLKKCTEFPLSNIFDHYYKSGGIPEYNRSLSDISDYNTLSKRVLTNLSYIYGLIYENKSPKGYVHWISEDMLKQYSRKSIIEIIRNYLNDAYLSNVNLNDADLSGANLRKAFLVGATLSNVNFRGANLLKADLKKADLHDTDLFRANLRQADLCGANLKNVKNISKAQFYETLYDENTIFPDEFIYKLPKFKKRPLA